MSFRFAAGFLLCTIFSAYSTVLKAQTPESIQANDNRVAAGALQNGVLSLDLELRKGLWHPEAEDGEAIPVYAFGETGKPLQIPAPMIRVPEGTVIEIELRNTLGVPATLHGLHERPGNAEDVITIPPGEIQSIKFTAGVAGTYLYWARTPDGARGDRRVVDSLTSGALVIDEPGAMIDDRVFVLERWNGPTRTAINGKSWPYTERITVEEGKRVHWRVINGSDLSHPMHLHGQHFNIDAEGNGEVYSKYAPDERPLLFTRTAEIGDTYEMSWMPHEPGRWLFHCHRIPHMRLPVDLEPGDALIEDDHEGVADDPLYAGMGGMVLQITVQGRHEEIADSVWRSARKLELVVDNRDDDPDFFKLTLREPATNKNRSSNALSGPTIVLQQDEPVEIKVINHLDVATAIHWHGMELESYYDGVPFISGINDKKAPVIEPGMSFTARMIPPKAGTMMYHTHWHDPRQLTGGVNGALIVMPRGQTYDPETDLPFVFTQSPRMPFGEAMLLMNGNPQPETKRLQTHTRYRFRFMNITPSVADLRVSLRFGGVPVHWRAIARDAVDLDETLGLMSQAELQVSVGETYDFEFEAKEPMELTLEGARADNRRRVVQTLVFSDPE